MTEREANAIAVILRSGGTTAAANAHLSSRHPIIRQAAQERLAQLARYAAHKGPGNGFFVF